MACVVRWVDHLFGGGGLERWFGSCPPRLKPWATHPPTHGLAAPDRATPLDSTASYQPFCGGGMGDVALYW